MDPLAPLSNRFPTEVLEREESPEQTNPLYAVLEKNQYPHTIEQLDGAIRQHFQVVDSTQTQAASLVDTIPPDTWLILSAEEQTKGRGFHSRRWASPPHVNVYATFMIPFPSEAADKVFFMAQIGAIAVARTIQKLGYTPDPEIKWPNDVMLNRKKVSGILPENKIPCTSTDYSVLLMGIGLNVNMDKGICDSLDQPVTSLAVEAGHDLDKDLVLKRLYQELRECVQQLLVEGFFSFLPELNSMMAYIGETIIVDRELEGPIQGQFVGMDESGRMKLRLEMGDEVVVQDGRIRKPSQTS
jgi:BirA family biotin operon repressor/biotin-[acetyl-CoA-carboxylase] ligase